ncbi:hypothetical protein GGR51DRAFT_372471 [Nemania sp. FL0031]|nr:hypothetical protein GGR51DRAFT_372471 [Nemania sp. FL0031]
MYYLAISFLPISLTASSVAGRVCLHWLPPWPSSEPNICCQPIKAYDKRLPKKSSAIRFDMMPNSLLSHLLKARSGVRSPKLAYQMSRINDFLESHPSCAPI